MPMPTPTLHYIENLVYRIGVFDEPHGSLEEVVARVSTLEVARAAYDAAVKRYPGKWVVLSLKAQVLNRSDEFGR